MTAGRRRPPARVLVRRWAGFLTVVGVVVWYGQLFVQLALQARGVR